MYHSVWILGAFTALWGVMAIFRPDWMKKFVDKMAIGQRFRGAAAVKITVGVLFLIFARQCRYDLVITVIGILMAGGSVLVILSLKPETIQAWIAWWQRRPVWVFRLWGIFAVLFGGLVIVAGLPK